MEHDCKSCGKVNECVRTGITTVSVLESVMKMNLAGLPLDVAVARAAMEVMTLVQMGLDEQKRRAGGGVKEEEGMDLAGLAEKEFFKA